MIRPFALFATLALLFGVSAAQADNYFWNPGTASGNWVSNNWNTPNDESPYTTSWADSNTANFTGAGQTITANSQITIAGINFTADGIQVVAGSGDLRLTGPVPVSVSGTNTATIAEDLVSIGAGVVLLKQGTGTLVLSGANNITTINVSAGTLRMGSSTALGSTASSPSLIVDGTLDLAGFSATRGALSGSGTVTNSSSATTSTLTVGTEASGSTTFSGLIENGAGTVALTKVGTGTMILSGTNTYTGGTNLNSGKLELNSAGALGTAGTISFNGGDLRFTSSNTTDYSARFSTDAGQQYRLDTNGQSVTLASNLTSDGGSLNKINSGTLTLSGSNEFTGGVTITNGRLVLNNANAIGSTGDINFAGGTMVFTASNTTDYSSRFTSTGTSPYSFDTGVQTVTLASDLAGSSKGLLKGGSGTLILSGTNTYGQTSQILNGTLRVNGSLASDVSVSLSGATLGGTGTLSGVVTVSTGGAIAPGNSVGTLTVGAISFADSTIFNAEIDGVLNTDADKLIVSGLASVTSGSNVVTVNLIGNVTDYLAGTPVTYTLMTSNPSSSLTDANFTLNTAGFTSNLAGTWDHTFSGGNLTVTFTPVPEPATVFGLGAMGLGLVGWIRRRRAGEL